MATRITFSNQEKDLAKAWSWYNDQKIALKSYRAEIINAARTSMPVQQKLKGLAPAELQQYFKENEIELEHLCSLDMVAATEALLRIDFYKKVYKKKKSVIAKSFRQLYKEKKDRISLEKDIIRVWQSMAAERKHDFSALIGLLKYRHWLAHGRYWKPKLEREYNAQISYHIARKVADFVKTQHD